MYNFFIFPIVAAILLAGCNGSKAPAVDTKLSKGQNLSTKTNQIKEAVPVTAIIVSKDLIPTLKRSLTVQLDKRVTEEVLTEVANKIKNTDTLNYERTFISFYLPNMTIKSSNWATVNFEPELKVQINGLTVDEAKFLLEQSIDSTYTIVGNWTEETLKRRTVIFFDKEKAFIKYIYTDNTSDTRPLREKKCVSGRLFEEAKVNYYNEFYLIDKSGDLLVTNGSDTIITGIKM